MIVVGQPEHLGRRTLLLLLSRRTTVAFILFIVSGAIAFLNTFLATGIAGLFSLGGSINPASVKGISSVISSLDMLIFLGSIILFLLSLIIGLVQYRNYIFVLDEFSLKVRRGIFSQTEISIPYRQIQDINLVRTISHRMFGVSRLILITAGHEDEKDHEQTDTIFDPIDADMADEVRTFLERRIGVQVIEGTVQADKEEKVEEQKTVADNTINQDHA